MICFPKYAAFSFLFILFRLFSFTVGRTQSSLLWRVLERLFSKAGFMFFLSVPKTGAVGCGRGYVWSEVQTAYGPADATATHCLLLQ